MADYAHPMGLSPVCLESFTLFSYFSLTIFGHDTEYISLLRVFILKEKREKKTIKYHQELTVCIKSNENGTVAAKLSINTKGHLISEKNFEDIDFPKLQRKYC